MTAQTTAPTRVDYRTDPTIPPLEARVEGGRPLVARHCRRRGIRPGYKLKLNSYDLGVDIELPTRSTACASSTRCAR